MPEEEAEVGAQGRTHPLENQVQSFTRAPPRERKGSSRVGTKELSRWFRRAVLPVRDSHAVLRDVEVRLGLVRRCGRVLRRTERPRGAKRLGRPRGQAGTTAGAFDEAAVSNGMPRLISSRCGWAYRWSRS